MYLLYLDESGNENDPADRYFVLAGLALFERQTYYLNAAFDDIQERYFPNHQPIVFHASEMMSGRGFWRSVPDQIRRNILNDLIAAIVNLPNHGRIAYASAVQKSGELYGMAAVERATEDICRRFDIQLSRHFHERGSPQRGLLIFSEGRFDARARIWVNNFRQRGTSWGTINNLADIPYFASMKESRLLQASDIIAHAVWLLYERRNATLFSALAPCFDVGDGVLHGLVHVNRSADCVCECPACTSRHNRGSYGNWLD